MRDSVVAGSPGYIAPEALLRHEKALASIGAAQRMVAEAKKLYELRQLVAAGERTAVRMKSLRDRLQQYQSRTAEGLGLSPAQRASTVAALEAQVRELQGHMQTINAGIAALKVEEVTEASALLRNVQRRPPAVGKALQLTAALRAAASASAAGGREGSRSAAGAAAAAAADAASALMPQQFLYLPDEEDYSVLQQCLKTGYDAGVDSWALGVILYILLAGEMPFYEEAGVRPSTLVQQLTSFISFDRQEVWGTVSPLARDLILGLLHPNPKKRVTPAEALLHPWLQQQPQKQQPQQQHWQASAPSPPPPSSAAKPCPCCAAASPKPITQYDHLLLLRQSEASTAAAVWGDAVGKLPSGSASGGESAAAAVAATATGAGAGAGAVAPSLTAKAGAAVSGGTKRRWASIIDIEEEE